MIWKFIFAPAVIALGLVGTAFAATTAPDPAELKAVGGATITAAEAVASVESKSRGKVVELTLRSEGGRPVYQVSVSSADGIELTYLVDAESGALKEASDIQDTAQSALPSEKAETGESASDQDSNNEDAN